jgi:hypothetical protein
MLSYYSAFYHPWITLNECLDDPVKYDGYTITSFKEPMIGNIYSDGFQLILKDGNSIRVYCDTTGLISREYIGLIAVFHQEGYLVAKDLMIARNRRHKIWLSIIPVLFVCILLFNFYRFNLKKFLIESRSNA